MEAGEENSGNINMKRQRIPLSDSEDNLLSAQEVNDGQKRRRLEPAGQENRSPKPSSSGRLDELKMKQDTPMVPSVQSRVQQLTQRRQGGAPLAQRCLSDPGADSHLLIRQDKVFREHLLGEGEFNQRMERFKVPVFQISPASTQSPANPCPRTPSNTVTGIHQKLQGTETPSSKQASRIRQEREKELNLLQFQPISKNAWLKRSSSDLSLSQVDGDAKITDGSFIEAFPSGAQPPSVTGTPCSIEGPAASVELQLFNEGQQQMEWEEQNTGQGPEFRENREDKPSVGSEEQQSSFLIPEAQTVVQLSFGEDPNESELPTSSKQSLFDSICSDETNVRTTGKVSVVTEQTGPVEDDEKNADSYHGEEEIEISTDEDLMLWRYPQDIACKEEESIVVEVQEEGVCVKDEQGESEPSRGFQQTRQVHVILIREDDMDQGSEEMALGSRDIATAEAGQLEININDGVKSVNEAKVSDHLEETDEVEQGALGGRQSVVENGLTEETHKAKGGETLKKVTFILEPELINDSSSSETNMSMESMGESSVSDGELSSHDETNTAEIIDQMFEEVLEYAGRIEEERRDDEDTEDHDSGIDPCSGDKDKIDTESEKEKSEEGREARDEVCDESKELEINGDELMTFPSCGILSPLSKSVEAVVTPLRLAASKESNPLPLLLTPEDGTTPLAESAPLYSIDAYRTQRQSKLRSTQSVTPGVQRRAPEKSQPQPSINTKEKISALNTEAAKLQTVINQTLQALSCCTDEEHGRGSLEEAEAEKLLLVSCEKRSALLAEVARLREDRGSDSAGEDGESVSQQPCRGTVSITNIQLPLKVEFVCSSHNRTGRPSHYFFVLIRYGPSNIVATTLATAADAQNGDTISFQTSVTLKDIRSTFEIDVEVYSLSHTAGSNCSVERTTTRSRVTPRKLLNTITRSSNSLTSAALPALNTRRSSNFCLVGSHKITLASLGLGKFPLDKMKLEGKIRRLLGDEFQEKLGQCNSISLLSYPKLQVPFLSPLEGNIYLQLDSESHSSVQHQGFLTKFELISGFGVWHRRYFTLEGCTMHYWNHPNDKETKEAEGSICLSSSPNQCVRPVKRDSCARPFTFELVSNVPQQPDDSQGATAKCWFSADTKQDRLDWIEKLSQALLDFYTWNRPSAPRTESQQSNTSGSLTENLRESIL